jgi:hypothetical protein
MTQAGSAGAAKLLTALLLAGAVSGCGSTIADRLPAAAGGLPENAPERPAVAPVYPAVHEVPPQRASATLNNDEQRKLQQDLIAARNRVGGDPDSTGTPKPAAASNKNP